MKVQEIHFNHDTASASSDAINLRQDGTSVITAPEWVDGNPARPAAYARSEIRDRRVTIKVLLVDGPPGVTVAIRAVVGSGSSSVLGPTKLQRVEFDANGQSALVPFTLTPRARLDRVIASQVVWTWQAWDGGRWVDFASTQHPVYVIPALPTAPWCQDPREPNREQLPWVTALDKACQWAAGARTLDGAAALIANAINTHAKHVYDELGEQYAPATDNLYHLSTYLQDLDAPGTFIIDCRGTSTAMLTFANLLGVGLWRLKIESCLQGGFQTNKVQPFSRNDWAAKGWGRHEITLVPGIPLDLAGVPVPGGLVPETPLPCGTGQDLLIYDAGLHVNELAPLFPVRMRLGRAGAGGSDYRYHLIAAGDGDKATPKSVRPLI